MSEEDHPALSTVHISSVNVKINHFPTGETSYGAIVSADGEPDYVTVEEGKTQFKYKGRVLRFEGARIFPNLNGKDVSDAEVTLENPNDPQDGEDMRLEVFASMIQNHELEPVGVDGHVGGKNDE